MKKNVITLLLNAILIFFSFSLPAQILKRDYKKNTSYKVEQWQVHDLVFKAVACARVSYDSVFIPSLVFDVLTTTGRSAPKSNTSFDDSLLLQVVTPPQPCHSSTPSLDFTLMATYSPFWICSWWYA